MPGEPAPLQISPKTNKQNKAAANSSAPGQAGKSTQIAGQPGSPCLISYPSASVPLVGTVGGGCLFSKTSARALVGGLLVGVGGFIFVGGIVVLAAAGFRKTGAVDKLAAGVGFVPGVGPVAAAGIRSAARPGSRRPRSDGQGRLGEPRENPNLRVGKGAVRETPAGTRRRRESASDEPPF